MQTEAGGEPDGQLARPQCVPSAQQLQPGVQSHQPSGSCSANANEWAHQTRKLTHARFASQVRIFTLFFQFFATAIIQVIFPSRLVFQKRPSSLSDPTDILPFKKQRIAHERRDRRPAGTVASPAGATTQLDFLSRSDIKGRSPDLKSRSPEVKSLSSPEARKEPPQRSPDAGNGNAHGAKPVLSPPQRKPISPDSTTQPEVTAAPLARKEPTARGECHS